MVTYLSGVAGVNSGVVTDCYATGDVTGDDKNVDGVTGENNNAGTLTDCCWSNSLETGIGDGTKPESCPQPAP
ncbi:hypothetical protein [uncultured Alistipes sp.]|uniref:hypothetical protein n=1 Tax=uncultured Alistipes sp. TaxID=538949 RepID=UPI00320B71B2